MRELDLPTDSWAVIFKPRSFNLFPILKKWDATLFAGCDTKKNSSLSPCGLASVCHWGHSTFLLAGRACAGGQDNNTRFDPVEFPSAVVKVKSRKIGMWLRFLTL